MICNVNCGCQFPLGIIAKTVTQFKLRDDVLRQSCYTAYVYNKPAGEVELPLVGFYIVSISSNGSRVEKAFDTLETGTNFRIIKVSEVNSKIKFRLGNTSEFTYGNEKITTSVGLQHKVAAGIAIRYLGDLDGTPAFTGSTELINNTWTRQYRFTDEPVTPVTKISKWFASSSSNYSDHFNTSSVYISKFSVPESKEYRIRMMGDDVGSLIIDGKPVVWGSDPLYWINRNHINNASTTIGGSLSMFLEAGEHEYIVYNQNTGAGWYLWELNISDDNFVTNYVQPSNINKVDFATSCPEFTNQVDITEMSYVSPEFGGKKVWTNIR